MTGRRHLWAKTPESMITDPDLTPSARLVYEYLDLRAGKRGYWYGGQREIAQALEVGERTVRRAAALLEQLGYISRERSADNRTVHTYWIAERIDPDGPAEMAGPTGQKWPVRAANGGRSDRPKMAGPRARAILFPDLPQTTPQKGSPSVRDHGPYERVIRRGHE